jgi:hypothetical protein
MTTTTARPVGRPPRQAPANPGGTTWRHQAACRIGVDPELFFPVATSGTAYDAQVAKAKAICGRCPVRTSCLEEALLRIPGGIAGGLTEEERRRLNRAVARSA